MFILILGEKTTVIEAWKSIDITTSNTITTLGRTQLLTQRGTGFEQQPEETIVVNKL